MAHELNTYVSDLPAVEDWLAGDSRTLVFTVVDSSGSAVDISNATVSWSLHDRPYETDASTAVLSGSDSDVELVTDARVDTTAGEWEVRVDPSATTDLWGEFTQRPVVEQQDGSTASWRGEVVLTA